MSDLEIRVNNYINNVLLDFHNINTNDLQGKDYVDSILNRLFSRKWSRKAQSEEAKTYTKEKVNYIVNNKLPFLFCFCFGGYKHFWTPSYPEPDWAEIFSIKYLIEYLLPIVQTYKYGVKLEFESEEVALSLMNNTPQQGMDIYNEKFRKIIDYLKNNIKYPIDFNLVLARNFYDKEKLINKMYDYKQEVEERFNALPLEEQKNRLKRAETNIMWNGVKDLTNISSEERKKVIYDSRILNEAFLDIDYELRGKEYFEQENLIPLLGTFGIGAGGENWLHLASTSSSFVDFWAGIGILEVRKDKIIQKNISKKQFDKIKDKLIKIELNNDLLKISNNFSYIYVYEGTLQF